MFTRNQFEETCKTYCSQHSEWAWEPSARSGYGFMTRETVHTSKRPPNDDQLEELVDNDLECQDQDASILVPASVINVTEYVVYSASFGVSAFYFTIRGSNGAPLQLDEIIQTSLFRLKPTQSNAFSLSGAPGSFPLLSQGDHPSLGIPCWYFHPCETQTAVDEFMAEEPGSSLDRWLELWFMIVGSILTL